MVLVIFWCYAAVVIIKYRLVAYVSWFFYIETLIQKIFMVRVDSLAIWNFSKNLIRSRNLDSTGSKNVAIEKKLRFLRFRVMNLRASESVIKYTSSCQIDNFTLYGNAERNCIRHFIAICYFTNNMLYLCVDKFSFRVGTISWVQKMNLLSP